MESSSSCFTTCKLQLFRDLHESFLDELCRSRHGVRIDLDTWKQVGIAPAMNLCSGTAQFNLHATLHQVLDEFLVWIPCRNIPVSVVRLVMQRHVAGVCVEYRDDFRRRIPIRLNLSTRQSPTAWEWD